MKTEYPYGRRGFASMPIARVRTIAAQGGRAAWDRGTAHRWTPDTAAIAGRKGGLARSAALKETIHAPLQPDHQ
jgi:hypothetical protein